MRPSLVVITAAIFVTLTLVVAQWLEASGADAAELRRTPASWSPSDAKNEAVQRDATNASSGRSSE